MAALALAALGARGRYGFYEAVDDQVFVPCTSPQTYNGVEITGTKRMSNRWQMLMGYTYSQTRQEGLSISTNPNNLINAEGPVTGQIGDRPHQFKLTGTYILPFYDIGFAANLNRQSGALLRRGLQVRSLPGQPARWSCRTPCRPGWSCVGARSAGFGTSRRRTRTRSRASSGD